MSCLRGEARSLAPLLFLCLLLGVFPYLLLDWMDTSVVELMRLLTIGG